MIVRKVGINSVYEKPEMEVIKFSQSDVVTTSGDEPFLGEDDMLI